MADGEIAGAIFGGCCGALCTAIQYSWCMQNTFGANSCKCCDKMCHCKCCWDEGEFNPDDYPDPKPEPENPPPYPLAAKMEVPRAGTGSEVPAPASTPATSTAPPVQP